MSTARSVDQLVDHRILVGTNDSRHQFYVNVRLGPDDLNRLIGRQTVTHEILTAEPLTLSMTYDEIDPRARHDDDGFVGGGAGVPSITTYVTRPTVDHNALSRMAAIADRWHLNSMTSGCIHQPDSWVCTAMVDTGKQLSVGGHSFPEQKPCLTRNGWTAIRELFGPHPYPKRGDSCYQCGRNRWDEPTDHCKLSGYRYGTAWLVEIIPDDVVAEIAAWKELEGAERT